MDLEKANAYIGSFASVLQTLPEDYKGFQQLKVGVDLGTANICIAVLDENDRPITGEIYPASVVKDGLVVDYLGAVAIVRELKERIEKRLGTTLEFSAAAVPPGTIGKNASAVSNVIESAGIDVIALVDEPAAAATAMNTMDGAVVDVGGGTTGVSILKNGQVIASHDEPTGGTHMTLVLAGSFGVSVEEAEKIKLNPKNHRDIFHLIKPVGEKMATIVRNFLRDYPVDQIYVVGGASCFDGFEDIFTKECGVKALKPEHCLLVTPLGIAMHCIRK